ncbi:splicing regulatory glutamine/lysine-rich protein 1 [Stomoxys calcitrans]|uniref:splicing regulatory glutamine/lysine-rich protein 1 n=1 Tax=Stomoxys calcitrans TaxID=35570 RepID=UPI0027E29A85|nr:splicing regulatory glutamine/lysine-rich protein 1 [Stomoxys calcitrans]XP_013105655.2 splicing regulatory glutamine/lysine-rich protein 1 [Stomoxys calcitrans]
MQNSWEKEVPNFVANCKARLQKILERLNWTEESVLKNFNTNSVASVSVVPKSSKISLSPRKATFPESLVTDNSIVLETPNLQNLLNNDSISAPENFNELQGNFNREQKLQIYQHVIENTKKLDNSNVGEGPEGVDSLADIVAAKTRDAKRKKRKFRKSKPTRIEEVRALVQLQMQALEQFIENQHEGQNTKDYEDKREINRGKHTIRDTNYIHSSNSHGMKTEESTYNCKNNSKEQSYSSYRSSRDISEQNYNKNIHPKDTHYKKPEDRQHDYGKRERKHRSRSPAHDKYKEKPYKDHTKYRESNHYKRHKRDHRSRSPVHDKYQNTRSSKDHKRYGSKAREYEKRLSNSRESRKHYDRYEKSTKEHKRRRSRSSHSSDYCPDSKRDRHYDRRKSKSPGSSKSRGHEKYEKSSKEKI